MPAAARVLLTRTHKKDVGQRQVVVTIDEGAKTTLMFGDRVALDVAPGDHVLKAHNTLVRKSIPFRVQAGEQVTFTLINHPGRFTLGFLALIGVAPLFLTIEEQRSTLTPTESAVPDRA
ncbi:MAG TPA: hypothetical protein VFV98_17695 [Vicinamibacterales bacterium]|nr:hypothetical protein [Vicinamibacterales bacterium]